MYGEIYVYTISIDFLKVMDFCAFLAPCIKNITNMYIPYNVYAQIHLYENILVLYLY